MAFVIKSFKTADSDLVEVNFNYNDYKTKLPVTTKVLVSKADIKSEKKFIAALSIAVAKTTIDEEEYQLSLGWEKEEGK